MHPIAVDTAISLERGAVRVILTLDPVSVTVERAGVPLIEGAAPWAAHGDVRDRFIQWTEGVVPDERLSDPELLLGAKPAPAGPDSLAVRGTLSGGPAELRLSLRDERVVLEWDAPALRRGVRWPDPGARYTGLGARHGLAFDQSGRSVRLGCDRRYTGPDCPPELLEEGGIPQGDCAPVPWLVSDAGYSLWLETVGEGGLFDLGVGEPRQAGVSQRSAAGPFRLHVFTRPTPAGRLRDYLRLTGMPALLPEWAYGHWKSRDVYEHERDVLDDFEGYREHRLPLDAIVIDSPWETQYNTWEWNPHQFPDPEGLVRRMRARGVRTVVWITPWVNLESSEGQKPPDAESEKLHARPASNYAEGLAAGHYIRDAEGEALVARWWMGTGSPVDFTSPAAEEWWRMQARHVLDMGVEGIKADDGDGYYLPPDARFADGRSGAEAAWAWGGLYRECMQRALDESHPGSGVLFGRSGWTGQQSRGLLWGGDQASDFWSLRSLVAATLTVAASGFSNWSHDVGGYLGHRLAERCPRELLVRWAQFGCFTPLMHAHGRFPQEAWTYDRETLRIYREHVLLHEQLVPYVRAAAATAARSGLPVIRPLCLIDPSDPRGWRISDAYGYGPSLWVAPVLEEGARERDVSLPAGRWIDWWTGERHEGGGEVTAPAPLDRVPLFVREGSLIVTYPREHVAEGLGDVPEGERPLVATLWGKPRCGVAAATLADGTRVRWRDGELHCAPERDLAFEAR